MSTRTLTVLRSLHPLSLAALLLLVFAPTTHAQPAFFGNDTTLDATNPVLGNAIVGYASQDDYDNGRGTSPTIHLVTGGSVSDTMYSYNHSTINVSGGRVGFQLAYNSSTINFSGGSAHDVVTYESSRVNVSGGSINSLEIADNSTGSISGGGISNFLGGNITMTGGSIGSFIASGIAGSFNLRGGNIGVLVVASGVTLNGSSVDRLDVTTGTVDIRRGNVGSLSVVGGTSTANLTGGNVGDIQTYDGTINLSGGSVGENLFANYSGAINLVGRNLSVILIDPNAFGIYSQYRLSGTLLDNADITGKNLYIENGSAHFTLTNVPAPGALLTAFLGAMPGLGVLMRRRLKAQSF